MHEFLSKALENTSIVWFKASNSYIILEEIAAQLVHQILEKKTFFDTMHTLIKGNKTIVDKIYLDLFNIFKTHL